jgi:hypothetical protein
MGPPHLGISHNTLVVPFPTSFSLSIRAEMPSPVLRAMQQGPPRARSQLKISLDSAANFVVHLPWESPVIKRYHRGGKGI